MNLAFTILLFVLTLLITKSYGVKKNIFFCLNEMHVEVLQFELPMGHKI